MSSTLKSLVYFEHIIEMNLGAIIPTKIEGISKTKEILTRSKNLPIKASAIIDIGLVSKEVIRKKNKIRTSVTIKLNKILFGEVDASNVFNIMPTKKPCTHPKIKPNMNAVRIDLLKERESKRKPPEPNEL